MLVFTSLESVSSMKGHKRVASGLALAAAMLATGCGDGHIPTYPVKGKLTYQDGSPVSAAVITFQPTDPPAGSKPLPARGVVQDDGTFELTTFTTGDGAVAGHHRVTVMEPYSTLEPGARPPSRG